MGTTIDDIYEQQTDEKYYLQEQIEDGIKDRKNSYAEGAEKIYNYLPINRNQVEDNYLDHLWDAFTTVNGLGEAGIGFSIMPFHLLFMLSLQYKVLRILLSNKKECELVFNTAGGRHKDELMKVDRNVYTIAFLNESTIPELLCLVGADEKLIKRIKATIKYRNENIAHPKGGTTPDLEKRIAEYIEILEELQPLMVGLNDEVANKWLGEMEPGESGVEYIELHLAEEFLCPADMQQGKLAKMEEKFNEK